MAFREIKTQMDNPELFEIREEMLEMDVEILEDNKTATLPLPPFRQSDFDNNGMLKISTLHSIIDVALVIMLSKNEKFTNRNYLEFHKIADRRIFFMVCAASKIDKKFYSLNLQQPAFAIKSTLRHIGKSSTSGIARLICMNTGYVYVERITQFAVVDPVSRQPLPVPSWWYNKYIELMKQEDQPIRMSLLEAPIHAFECEIKVPSAHMDFNQHTAASAYISYFIDAACKAALAGFFSKIKNDFRLYPITALDVSYHGESRVDDLLCIRLWENKDRPFVVHGIMTKNSAQIFQCTTTLSDEMDKAET